MPSAENDARVWECGPHTNAWGGHDARCRQVLRTQQACPDIWESEATCEHAALIPEGYPCGHASCQPGCGGCDPGAIEFVRDDGGPWVRPIPPASTVHPAADPSEGDDRG